MPRHGRTILAALGFAGLIGAADANAQCREGTREFARVQIGPREVNVYCVCIADHSELQAAVGRTRELEEQVKQDRASIERWQKDLPDFQRSLDEWVDMDEKARAETRQAALDAGTTALLGGLRLRANQNIRASQADLRKLKKKLDDSVLGSRRFKDLQRQRARANTTIREWRDFREAVEEIENARDTLGLAGLDPQEREDYARALIDVMSTALESPQLNILVAEVDFMTTALLGNLTAQLASARVQQLVNLGDERLKAMASLAKLYKQHVDELKKLRNRQAALYQRAASGQCR